jgi:hypothetical protein
MFSLLQNYCCKGLQKLIIGGGWPLSPSLCQLLLQRVTETDYWRWLNSLTFLVSIIVAKGYRNWLLAVVDLPHLPCVNYCCKGLQKLIIGGGWPPPHSLCQLLLQRVTETDYWRWLTSLTLLVSIIVAKGYINWLLAVLTSLTFLVSIIVAKGYRNWLLAVVLNSLTLLVSTTVHVSFPTGILPGP